MKFCSIFLLLFITSTAFANKINFCSITLNSSNEIDFLKKNLSHEQFNFVELTNETTNFETDWMAKSCQENTSTQCDILLISGHFAGEVFFGVRRNSGRRVFTHHLLDKVCNQSCDHILKSPKLVFLFGGHTLSSQEESSKRTRQLKTQLIKAVSSEIGPGASQRLAEARYGPYGKAYFSQMQRLFSPSSTILGFNSKGVSGRSSTKYLRKFLRKIRNFAAQFKREFNQTPVGQNSVEAIQSVEPIIASRFGQAFKSVGGAVCLATTPESEQVHLNSLICSIKDEATRVDERLEITKNALKDQTKTELMLPWIEEFMRKHPPILSPEKPNIYSNFLEQKEYSQLLTVAQSTKFKETFENLYNKTSNGFTKIQLLSLKRYLGITTQEESIREIKPLLKKELKRLKKRGLDQDTIDLLCQLWPTVTPVLSSENILDTYSRRTAWKKGITKLNNCIRREKARFRSIHGN